MSTEEKMTIDERYKYLRMVQERYWAADRAGRSRPSRTIRVKSAQSEGWVPPIFDFVGEVL